MDLADIETGDLGLFLVALVDLKELPMHARGAEQFAMPVHLPLSPGGRCGSNPRRLRSAILPLSVRRRGSTLPLSPWARGHGEGSIRLTFPLSLGGRGSTLPLSLGGRGQGEGSNP